MYTIPKDLIARWEQQKKGFLAAAANKNPPAGMSAEGAAFLRNEIPRMMREFDQGLKSKMKAAASAKDDASARKAAAAVAKVAMDYRRILETFGKQTEVAGRGVTVKSMQLMDDIAHHAEASVKSRPPIRAPRDFHDSTMAKLKAASLSDSTAPDELRVSAGKMAAVVGRMLDLNEMTQAKSDPALFDAAKRTRAKIATPGRAQIDQWAQPRGRAAEPTKRALHKALDDTDRIVLDILDDLRKDIHRTKSAD